MLDDIVKKILLVFLAAFPTTLLAQDSLPQLLKQITDVPSPPGYEEPMRNFMAEKMRPYADSILVALLQKLDAVTVEKIKSFNPDDEKPMGK